jgi:hypothetical protein
LTCFFYPFCESLQKINDELIEFDRITDKILSENRIVTNIYLRNIYIKFIEKNCSIMRESLHSLNTQLKSSKFDRQFFVLESQVVYKKSLENILDFINLVKVSII